MGLTISGCIEQYYYGVIQAYCRKSYKKAAVRKYKKFKLIVSRRLGGWIFLTSQLRFAKAHYKTTPTGKVDVHGLGLGKLPYIWGFPLLFLQRPSCPLSVSKGSATTSSSCDGNFYICFIAYLFLCPVLKTRKNFENELRLWLVIIRKLLFMKFAQLNTSSGAIWLLGGLSF